MPKKGRCQLKDGAFARKGERSALAISSDATWSTVHSHTLFIQKALRMNVTKRHAAISLDKWWKLSTVTTLYEWLVMAAKLCWTGCLKSVPGIPRCSWGTNMTLLTHATGYLIRLKIWQSIWSTILLHIVPDSGWGLRHWLVNLYCGEVVTDWWPQSGEKGVLFMIVIQWSKTQFAAFEFKCVKKLLSIIDVICEKFIQLGSGFCTKFRKAKLELMWKNFKATRAGGFNIPICGAKGRFGHTYLP